MSNVIKYEEQKQELQTLKTMAAIAVNSGKYGQDYNEATVLNIFYTAKSLGVDPMVALNGGFNIIKGKINMSAHFMTALVRRKGHSIKVIEMTERKCVIIGQRKDNGDSLKYEYTWEEAAKAGFTNKPTWQTIPKQMLFCACVRNVFRILFSDIGIAYDQDEMNVDVGIDLEEPVIAIAKPPEFLEETQEATQEKTTNPYETLKDKLKQDEISLDYFDSYLKHVSEKQSKTIEEVSESALRLLKNFKTAYEKYVSKISIEPDLVIA